MRTIIPITCALCIATSSRADTPPAEAPVEPAPVKAPEQPAASSPAPATAPAGPPAADPFLADPVAPPPAHSRIPEIAATVVTGGFVIATGASYWKWNQAQARRRAAQWDPSITPEEHTRNIADSERWKKRTWLLIGGTFVSSAVTAFLWMRNQDPSSFSVQPTGDGDGAAVSYSGRF
jgi:hypothetical protein